MEEVAINYRAILDGLKEIKKLCRQHPDCERCSMYSFEKDDCFIATQPNFLPATWKLEEEVESRTVYQLFKEGIDND